ncbi:MAG TPA: galactokinase [Acidimicrobiales bacterium]|nr:galactokinase [Acidimicrobiales bacterium]
MTRVFAPGRVNLIGDHTDYTGGLVMPMAVDLGTTIHGARGGDVVRLTSDAATEEAEVPLRLDDPREVLPEWARYVAGVMSVMHPAEGFSGFVSTTLPVGAGLSSSAALEVAMALALGFEGAARDLALVCQKAEQQASGVPCGVMDQLASAAGVAGHALLIDCSTLEIEPVPLPADIDVVVMHSGEPRALASSEYAARRAACEAAEAIIGPLRSAGPDALAQIEDPTLQARARHVIHENARVRRFAGSLRAGDMEECGALMVESHLSLAKDFEVSTERLDQMVESLVTRPGVFGARLTGAGFGGCVVALAEPGALRDGWHVRPVDGARILEA